MIDVVLEYVEKMINVVGEDSFFNIVAAVIALLWAKAQRAVGVDRKKNTLYNKALSFLEAGVAKTYQEYVKERKKANVDGHLTEEEKKHARVMAYTYAKNYAMREGVSLVGELGQDMIPVLIEKTVGGLKREATGAVANTGTSNGVPAGPVVTTASTGTPVANPAVNPPANG